jgi:hypothetical protein
LNKQIQKLVLIIRFFPEKFKNYTAVGRIERAASALIGPDDERTYDQVFAALTPEQRALKLA